MKVKSHLNFEKSAQLIEITIQKVSTLPTGWEGGMVYHTGEKKLYYYTGTDWIPVNSTAGLITNVTSGDAINVETINETERKVTFKYDNSTVGVNANDKAEVKDAGITTVKLANKAVTYDKIEDMPTLRVLGNVSGTDGTPGAVTVLTDLSQASGNNDQLATADAIVSYLEDIVTEPLNIIDNWSASVNSSFPSGAETGDTYIISAEGTLGSTNADFTFYEGDMLVANPATGTASTTDKTDWITLKTKRGQAGIDHIGLVALANQAEARGMSDTKKALTPSNLADVRADDATGSNHDRFVTPQSLAERTATTSRTGIAELATEAEAQTGSDNSRIITPHLLHMVLDNAMGVYGKATADNSSGTSTTVNHGFGTRDLQVEVYEKSAPYGTVITDIRRPDTANVEVHFAASQTAGDYRIVIKK